VIALREAECCALAGTDGRPLLLRRRASRPQLKRDPLDSGDPQFQVRDPVSTQIPEDSPRSATAPRRPVLSRALLWFGAFVVGLLVFQFVAQLRKPDRSPLASTPVERMARRHAARLLSLPALRERLKHVSQAEALPTALALGSQALIYLDDSLLLERTLLANRIFQLVDDTTCGAVVQGHPSRPELLQAVGVLDSVSQERWVEITVTAIESQYRGATPSLVAPLAVQASLHKLLAHTPPDTAQRLTVALADLDSASRPEACWAARTLYSRVLVAPSSERRVLIRGLVQR